MGPKLTLFICTVRRIPLVTSSANQFFIMSWLTGSITSAVSAVSGAVGDYLRVTSAKLTRRALLAKMQPYFADDLDNLDVKTIDNRLTVSDVPIRTDILPLPPGLQVTRANIATVEVGLDRVLRISGVRLCVRLVPSVRTPRANGSHAPEPKTPSASATAGSASRPAAAPHTDSGEAMPGIKSLLSSVLAASKIVVEDVEVKLEGAAPSGSGHAPALLCRLPELRLRFHNGPDGSADQPRAGAGAAAAAAPTPASERAGAASHFRLSAVLEQGLSVLACGSSDTEIHVLDIAQGSKCVQSQHFATGEARVSVQIPHVQATISPVLSSVLAQLAAQALPMIQAVSAPATPTSEPATPQASRADSPAEQHADLGDSSLFFSITSTDDVPDAADAMVSKLSWDASIASANCCVIDARHGSRRQLSLDISQAMVTGSTGGIPKLTIADCVLATRCNADVEPERIVRCTVPDGCRPGTSALSARFSASVLATIQALQVAITPTAVACAVGVVRGHLQLPGVQALLDALPEAQAPARFSVQLKELDVEARTASMQIVAELRESSLTTAGASPQAACCFALPGSVWLNSNSLRLGVECTVPVAAVVGTGAGARSSRVALLESMPGDKLTLAKASPALSLGKVKLMAKLPNEHEQAALAAFAAEWSAAMQAVPEQVEDWDALADLDLTGAESESQAPNEDHAAGAAPLWELCVSSLFARVYPAHLSAAEWGTDSHHISLTLHDANVLATDSVGMGIPCALPWRASGLCVQVAAGQLHALLMQADHSQHLLATSAPSDAGVPCIKYVRRMLVTSEVAVQATAWGSNGSVAPDQASSAAADELLGTLENSLITRAGMQRLHHSIELHGLCLPSLHLLNGSVLGGAPEDASPAAANAWPSESPSAAYDMLANMDQAPEQLMSTWEVNASISNCWGLWPLADEVLAGVRVGQLRSVRDEQDVVQPGATFTTASFDSELGQSGPAPMCLLFELMDAGLEMHSGMPTALGEVLRACQQQHAREQPFHLSPKQTVAMQQRCRVDGSDLPLQEILEVSSLRIGTTFSSALWYTVHQQFLVQGGAVEVRAYPDVVRAAWDALVPKDDGEPGSAVGTPILSLPGTPAATPGAATPESSHAAVVNYNALDFANTGFELAATDAARRRARELWAMPAASAPAALALDGVAEVSTDHFGHTPLPSPIDVAGAHGLAQGPLRVTSAGAPQPTGQVRAADSQSEPKPESRFVSMDDYFGAHRSAVQSYKVQYELPAGWSGVPLPVHDWAACAPEQPRPIPILLQELAVAMTPAMVQHTLWKLNLREEPSHQWAIPARAARPETGPSADWDAMQRTLHGVTMSCISRKAEAQGVRVVLDDLLLNLYVGASDGVQHPSPPAEQPRSDSAQTGADTDEYFAPPAELPEPTRLRSKSASRSTGPQDKDVLNLQVEALRCVCTLWSLHSVDDHDADPWQSNATAYHQAAPLAFSADALDPSGTTALRVSQLSSPDHFSPGWERSSVRWKIVAGACCRSLRSTMHTAGVSNERHSRIELMPLSVTCGTASDSKRGMHSVLEPGHTRRHAIAAMCVPAGLADVPTASAGHDVSVQLGVSRITLSTVLIEVLEALGMTYVRALDMEGNISGEAADGKPQAAAAAAAAAASEATPRARSEELEEAMVVHNFRFEPGTVIVAVDAPFGQNSLPSAAFQAIHQFDVSRLLHAIQLAPTELALPAVQVSLRMLSSALPCTAMDKIWAHHGLDRFRLADGPGVLESITLSTAQWAEGMKDSMMSAIREVQLHVSAVASGGSLESRAAALQLLRGPEQVAASPAALDRVTRELGEDNGPVELHITTSERFTLGEAGVSVGQVLAARVIKQHAATLLLGMVSDGSIHADMLASVANGVVSVLALPFHIRLPAQVLAAPSARRAIVRAALYAGESARGVGVKAASYFSS